MTARAPITEARIRRAIAARCPPYQDLATLSANICLCASTVQNHVKQGILPQPRMIGGKRLWKWSEVEAYLDRPQGAVPDELAEKVRNGTRKAIAEAYPGGLVRRGRPRLPTQ